ncbi:MAG: hypothetical protein QG652_374 [Pseudomonadota bacterium]|nr:hypothetical protein [Pseudomonadota bacterium]
MKRISGFLLFTLLALTGMQARAVDYSLPDIHGRMQSLDQYRGKWVIVNYWATWCVTCRKELPDLIALHEKFRAQDVVVVGINFEVIDTARLTAFVREAGINYQVLRTAPVKQTPLGPVPALPVTYIINPAGEVVAGEIGLVSQAGLEDYLASQGIVARPASVAADGV